ncbi:hypothetical protein HDV00_005300 [Rhizophlyctis rosea]|nr:hypothetical protein HDV00_005300 [Rhizophlyctis rosea]
MPDPTTTTPPTADPSISIFVPPRHKSHSRRATTSSGSSSDESSPLLPGSGEEERSGWGTEAWKIVKTSTPVALTYMLQNSLQTACVLVVGRMGPLELASTAFAFMFAMVTAWVMALGSTTALDTLGSQAWTGAEDKHEVGIHLQRALLILTVLFVPIAALWWFAEPVLLMLGQEEELSHAAAAFLRVLVWGAPGYIYFEAVKKYLQAQGIMHASTMVLAIAALLNLSLLYLLVIHPTFSLGVTGGAVAVSITYWTMFLLLALYATFIKGHEAWGGWNKKCLTDWLPFLKLALPGILMVGSEWWAFEIVALTAGLLGTLPLAAQSVIMTADQILNTVPFGISVATSNRVGNLLGLRDRRGVKVAARSSAGVAAGLGGVMLVVMMACRNSFGRLFSDDDDVVGLVAKVLPYVALFQISDGLAGSCGGSLRGMGKQHIGATVNIVGFYFIALPVGIWLAFRGGMGLEGLWIGQCLGLGIVGGVELVLVWITNWRTEVRKCEERIARGEVLPSH